MTELRPYLLRGIRGAITTTDTSAASILDATERLLTSIVDANKVDLDMVASALFTVTPDLTAAFPAAAARRIGWDAVPLLNFTEIGVPNGLPRCIRVLIHLNTTVEQHAISHVYLGDAVALRPDLKPSPKSVTEQHIS